MSDPPKRKRRWLQFSLRSLLIFTVVCAIGSAWVARKIERKRQEQAAVDAIRKLGGDVLDDNFENTEISAGWLRWLLGENFFNEVIAARIANDDALANVRVFTHLRMLWLDRTHVTDTGLANVKGLMELSDLRLDGTQVTDAGLENLKGLTKLRELSLHDTSVTDAGVADLQKALPSCKIYH